MAEETVKPNEIYIGIQNGVLTCIIPLFEDSKDMSKSKMQTYGALKLAEEQASIFFMNEHVRRRQQKIITPADAKPFKPGVV